MLTYAEFDASRVDDVLAIYEDSGWDLYLSDRPKLVRAFERSLICLGAFEDGRLAGFIRCSGDGEYNVNVEDLIVHSAFRRRGIASTLVRMVCEKYTDIDMLTLITDINDPVSNGLYQSLGFQKYAQKALVGYAKQIRQ